MKVCFTLDNPKREVSTIRGSVSYSGKRYDFPTGESVKVNLFRNQRCKASPEAPAVNNKLLAVETAMKNAILYFKQSFKVPDKKEFREKVRLFLEGNNSIEIKRKEQKLVDYAEKYIEECGLAEETKKGYKTAKNKLAEYQATKGMVLYFEDINAKFETVFRKWLLEKHYSRNYIGTIFKNLKRFMEVARDVDELHNNQAYKKFKVDAESADTFYSDIDELIKIHRLEITEDLIRGQRKDLRWQNIQATVQALNVVKNKFLIGAFCCMRVSDFNRISEYNIQGRTIKIMPKKGSTLRKPEPVEIPMHWVVAEILNSGFDFHYQISDTKINKHIKEVYKLAGIDEQVVFYRTEGGELKQYVAAKWEVITSHTARRSGATNMYLAGMPIDLIMFCGGWRKRGQCENYIKATVNDVLKKLEKTDYFTVWGEQISIKDITVGWVKEHLRSSGQSVRNLAEKLMVPEKDIEDAFRAESLSPWQKALFYYYFQK